MNAPFRPAAAPPPGRTTAADLGFVRGGGRTVLARQSVPYPFHATRPYAGTGGLASLILQSASGGLFGGDRLSLAVAAGPGAAAHVMGQAATVVHAAAGERARLRTRVAVRDGAVLAVTADPYILFPGAGLDMSTEVEVAPGAAAVLAEGFAVHDPEGRGRPFGRLSTRCRVTTEAGAVLVDEGGAVDGSSFAGAASPLGPHRAFGSVLALGPAAVGLDAGTVEARLDALGVLCGASPLPNGAGLGLRLLAREGGALARGLDAAVALALAAATGRAVAARRR